MLLKQLFLK